MKLKNLLLCIYGGALAGCSDPYLIPPDPNDWERYDRKVCYEYTNGSRGKCTPDLRPVFSKYVVKRGQVYWMEKTTKTTSCYVGAMTAFIEAGMWRCLRLATDGTELIETRELLKAAAYSPAFQGLVNPMYTLDDWQSDQFAYYAKDKKSVYFKNKKIKGANPNTFSIIFPFGNDETWKEITMSQSAGILFFRWEPIGNIEPNKLRIFSPVKCPEKGISCAPKLDKSKNGSLHHGIIGSIGDDIFVLHENGVAHFPGKASLDAFIFRGKYQTYLYSHNKFYQLNSERDKLLQMNVEFYERYDR